MIQFKNYLFIRGDFRIVINKRFLVLAELASGQPGVSQRQISLACGITVQAVSEHVKELVKQGLVEVRGPQNYRVTPEGVEVLVEGGRKLRDRAREILEKTVKSERLFTAVAATPVQAGETVQVWMEKGLLRAGKKRGVSTTATVVSAAEAGDDLAVKNIAGIIDLKIGRVQILKMPSAAVGGSKNVDRAFLMSAIADGFVCALGVEALVAIRKAGRRKITFYGAIDAAVEACHHGLSPVVVASESELSRLIERLTDESIEYTLHDCAEMREK